MSYIVLSLTLANLAFGGFATARPESQGLSAQDFERMGRRAEREKLAGLKRLCLLEVNVSETMTSESEVPSVKDLKQRIELRMRVNRVPVFSFADLDWKDPKTATEFQTIPSANIWCSFSVLKNSNGQYIYKLDFYVTESCIVTRTRKGGITRIWERSIIGVAGKQVVRSAMMGAVEEYANELSNDYLAANP